MKKFNFIFADSDFKSARLLGRSAEEFMTMEFGDCPVVEAGEEERFFDDGAINVVLTKDMPLARREDIVRYYGLMRVRGISTLRLSDASPARIAFYPYEESEIFVRDEAFLHIDSAKSFNMVYNLLRQRIIEGHLSRGAYIYDSATVCVDDTVVIEAGAHILPFSRIEGASVVKSGAKIYASYICDSFIGAADVNMSHVVGSKVADGATVGPFARLRGADIGKNSRIGDFVEVKASTLEGCVKAAHLTYIGDAFVGDGTNVGCGTVFCNFDGRDKHRTTVGRSCFIGANTNLIAPLDIGDNSFIAAGTTVTEDTARDTFTIGRSRQSTRADKKKN